MAKLVSEQGYERSDFLDCQLHHHTLVSRSVQLELKWPGRGCWGLCTAHLHCQRQGLVPAEWEVGVGTLGCQVVGFLGIETWKECERT